MSGAAHRRAAPPAALAEREAGADLCDRGARLLCGVRRHLSGPLAVGRARLAAAAGARFRAGLERRASRGARPCARRVALRRAASGRAAGGAVDARHARRAAVALPAADAAARRATRLAAVSGRGTRVGCRHGRAVRRDGARDRAAPPFDALRARVPRHVPRRARRPEQPAHGRARRFRPRRAASPPGARRMLLRAPRHQAAARAAVSACVAVRVAVARAERVGRDGRARRGAEHVRVRLRRVGGVRAWRGVRAADDRRRAGDARADPDVLRDGDVRRPAAFRRAAAAGGGHRVCRRCGDLRVARRVRARTALGRARLREPAREPVPVRLRSRVVRNPDRMGGAPCARARLAAARARRARGARADAACGARRGRAAGVPVPAARNGGRARGDRGPHRARAPRRTVSGRRRSGGGRDRFDSFHDGARRTGRRAAARRARAAAWPLAGRRRRGVQGEASCGIK